MTPTELGKLFLEKYPVDDNGYTCPILIDDLVELCPDFRTKKTAVIGREVIFLGLVSNLILKG